MRVEKHLIRGLDEAIRALESLSLRLSMLAKVIIAASLVNIVATFLLASGLYYPFRVFPIPFIVVSVSAFSTIIALAACLRFDSSKKHGDAYFEELSDDLHAVHTSEVKHPESPLSENEIARDKLSFQARVSLRHYSSIASIPLVPGKFGPAVFVLLNLFLALFSASQIARYLS